jgi:5-methylcytosine-specific restriction endonuclease McrA
MRTSEKPRPLCGCGSPVQEKGKTKLGFAIWATGCGNCKRIAILNKKDYCEKCGGTEKLQVDHIDANRSNNELSNLQTLCQDCHHKKSKANNDFRRKNEAMLSL